ncbi:MAG TPA: hypothetical protein VEB60_02255 [Candidatus Paceibacterota bacterium]|nr:hypothetical protein [Candidatus Paceibacterota bacterium]
MRKKTKTFDQLMSSLRGLPLNLSDKASMRARLLGYMRAHPLELREKQPAPSLVRSPLSREFRFRALEILRYRYVPVALILAITLSGGLSAAAESALPGQTLYPIKTGINEEVVAIVSVKAESKAKWEGKRVTRRIEEAKKLAVDGQLTVEAKETIETKLKEHADKASEKIAEIKEEDKVVAVAVSTEVEAALRNGQKELTAVAEETGEATITAMAETASSSAATIAVNKAEIVKEVIVETIAAATTTPVQVATSTDSTMMIVATTTATSTIEADTPRKDKTATSTEPIRNDRQGVTEEAFSAEVQRQIEIKVLESISNGTLRIDLGF